ncbi:MAG: hypothetical protein ACOCXJ_09195, partial [Planctomycetota bacterium]
MIDVRLHYRLDRNLFFADDAQPEALLRVAHERWAADFSYSGSAPGRFTCGVVSAGCILGSWDGHSQRVPAGSCICWDARPRILRADPEDPPECWLVTLRSRRIETMARRCLGLSCGGLPLHDAHAPLTLLQTMHREAREGGPFTAELVLAQVPVLLWTLRRALLPTPDVHSRAQARYQEIRRL